MALASAAWLPKRSQPPLVPQLSDDSAAPQIMNSQTMQQVISNDADELWKGRHMNGQHLSAIRCATGGHLAGGMASTRRAAKSSHAMCACIFEPMYACLRRHIHVFYPLRKRPRRQVFANTDASLHRGARCAQTWRMHTWQNKPRNHSVTVISYATFQPYT